MGGCFEDVINDNVSKLLLLMIEMFEWFSSMLNVCKVSSIVNVSVNNSVWLHLRVCDSWFRVELNVRWLLPCWKMYNKVGTSKS